MAGRGHRPQLDCIECKRVERGTLIAQHVYDVLEIVGNPFVFTWMTHGS
jgi:hypothetical protein